MIGCDYCFVRVVAFAGFIFSHVGSASFSDCFLHGTFMKKTFLLYRAWAKSVSSFFQGSTWLLIAPRLLILCMALWLGVPQFTSLAQMDGREKIADIVWTDTENGGLAQVVVYLSDQADLTTREKGLVPEAMEQAEQGAYVFAALQAVQMRSQIPIQQLLTQRQHPFQPFWVVNAVASTINRGTLLALAAQPGVAKIESNRPFLGVLSPAPKPSAAPMQLGVEPNIAWIHADSLWGLGYTGQNMVVASADTGVDWSHLALKDKYRGWDGASVNHDYAWHDAIHSDISGNGTNPCGFSSLTACDDYGHGSHTVGIMVGDDGSNQIGVAPGAKWIACRNMEQGYGQLSTYLECLQFFLAPTQTDGSNPDPSMRPHIINNSYACGTSEGCGYTSLDTAIQNLRSAGIMFVAAAGNSGPSCNIISFPPAMSPYAFTIGATYASSDTIASFSSRGPIAVNGSNLLKPDMVAPGQGIRSSVLAGGYAYLSGTSMAAPHVAGSIALLWSAHPWLLRNVALTEQYYRQTVRPLTSSQTCGSYPGSQVPNAVYGYGALDVLATHNFLNSLYIYYFPYISIP